MGVFGLDLEDPALFDSGFPHRSFTGIRRDCPVAWHDIEHDGLPDGGFWSVAGYPECVAVLDAFGPATIADATLLDDLTTMAALELARTPGLFETLRDDPALLPTAAEELARWTSPLAGVTVVAQAALQLDRHLISPGERVVCWLASANRDERVFGSTAMELRPGRSPNPHLAYTDAPELGGVLHARLATLIAGGRRPTIDGEPTWLRSDPPGHRCVIDRIAFGSGAV